MAVTMTLQFINHTVKERGKGPSITERRVIRSHVMQGKNAGKSRRSRRRQPDALSLSSSSWSSLSPPSSTNNTKNALPDPTLVLREVAAGMRPPKTQVFWNDLSLTTFPQQLDSESTKLMHRWFFDISDALFPPQFCTKFDIVKSIWVNCVLADEAYFHCTLAVSASYVDFFERKPRISRKTLYHISQAYALVNHKLTGPHSISDSAIAAVVTLAIYQQIHHLYATGLLHLKGLYRMIQLRGGIARLMAENRALALKPLRLDAELALQTGLPTLFCSDVVVFSDNTLYHSNVTKEDIDTSSKLPSIRLGVFSFASQLNERDKDGRTKFDPLNYTEALVALLYRLIEVTPLRRPQTCSMMRESYDEVEHLAMLAFMTTLLPTYSSDDSIHHPILASRLECAVQNLQSTLSSLTQGYKLPLLLWTLFIGGISVLKHKDYGCLILETCARLNLYDWPAIQGQLCHFPWIHTLHNAPGQHLWDDSQHRGLNVTEEF